jgi:putative transposase
MWFQETEGAKFWMQVLTELKDRGVRDILICCVDGLEGFPEAIEAIFPATMGHPRIVHLIRASLRYVRRGDYDVVVKDLRAIYTAIDADRALHAVDAFEAKWGQSLPPVVRAWREAWDHVIPFLEFPARGTAGDLHHG